MLTDLRARAWLARKLAGSGLALLLVLGACSSPAEVPGPDSAVRAGAPVTALDQQREAAGLGHLVARADAGEALRVIVELDVAVAPAHDLGGSARAAERAEITAAQDSLVGRLQGTDSRVVRQFSTAPLIAMTVDAA